ncbi:uncharacterized protein LOC129015356 [Pongo pygmaeus]|uniref:uncharacterized protein LOC129015356 n=1 Tax=Pongo pygmaeus TaxID=9600 RepID=UPI0023E2BB74|nr:uncharacterized protein LOC129015356 [Pongo pygmaeus]
MGDVAFPPGEKVSLQSLDTRWREAPLPGARRLLLRPGSARRLLGPARPLPTRYSQSFFTHLSRLPPASASSSSPARGKDLASSLTLGEGVGCKSPNSSRTQTLRWEGTPCLAASLGTAGPAEWTRAQDSSLLLEGLGPVAHRAGHVGISPTAPHRTGGIILQGPLLPMKETWEMLPGKPGIWALDHFGVNLPSAHPSFGGSWGEEKCSRTMRFAASQGKLDLNGYQRSGASSWRKVARGLLLQGGLRSTAPSLSLSYPTASSIPAG